MTRTSNMIRSLAFLALCCIAISSRAEDPGQADLDQATELKVTSQSMDDLGKVIKLCDSALDKGLEDANAAIARRLLMATLFQRGEQLCKPILDQTPPDQRWPLMRRVALLDLERVIELQPDMSAAHLLIARLHRLPGGDLDRGRKAANAAVTLTEDEPKELAAALVVRAQFLEDSAKRLKDYDRAIGLDPTNADAWKGRAATYLGQGDFEKAIEDFNRLVEDQKDDPAAHLALAEALFELERYDQAKKRIAAAIELDENSSAAYTLRARLHLVEEKAEPALADLNRAIQLRPNNAFALLLRAQVRLDQEELAGAKDDIERVLLIVADLPQGLLIRSMIYAHEGRLSDAIADMKQVLEQDPENIGWQLQLAGYYLQDQRPTKGIDLLTKILEQDGDNWIARQARADTFLSIGKHAEAVEDFEVAFRLQPDNDSLLNNFAWVLATSPDDGVRDGKRAVKLATKACEVTDYKKAHILSTLAAAYAETGDFAAAIKWSGKAVGLGVENDEVDEQLKKELDSYKQKKAWRERQTIEEKADPVQPRRSRFEA